MKTQLALAVTLAVIVAITTAAPAGDTYTTKWDGIDLDQILASERLLKNYVNCIMERGSCTPDGSELKRVLPEALESDCKKCSEAQKKGSDKVVRYLIANKPNTWKEVSTKYDPNGVYRSRHPEIFN